MKIVIISSSFFETTVPLANYLSRSNDVYLYSFFSNRFLNPPGFDLSLIGKRKYNDIVPLSEIGLNSDHSIIRYLSGSRLNLSIIVFSLNFLFDLLTLLKLVRKVKKISPDIVHFIGSNHYYSFLYLLLGNFKIVQTLHEINFSRIEGEKFELKSFINNAILQFSIKKIIKMNGKFIFHSANVENDFKNVFKYDKTSVIPFGRFEMYTFSDSLEVKGVGNGYYLFFGYVRSYKGADILVDSMRYINKVTNNINVVIAGKDSGKLNDGNLPENITLIDKYLDDREITFLISNCKAVIIPHRKASQTGIINSAYAFNKPVISSDIPGVSDFVSDKITGLIFRSENSESLADSIIQLNDNESLYLNIIDNISSDLHLNKLNWFSIANNTLDYYLSQTNNYK